MMVLALVDLVSTDRDKVYRTQYFPIIQALARRDGAKASWFCVGMDGEAQAARDNPFVFDPADEDMDRLCRRLEELAPTHVLLNERLASGAWRRLRGAVGDAEVARYPFPLERWFGQQPETGPDETLHPELLDISPAHDRELLNRLAQEHTPYTWLMLGPICLYRRPLSRNPDYAGIDLSGCASDDACSFCVPPRDERVPGDVVAAAMRQLLAAEATTPPEVRGRQYVVNGAALWFKLEAFLDALLAEDLPASGFYFHCRADELVRAAPALEARLAALEVAGHSINVFSMGVENFSEAENRRFNKGLHTADLRRAAELMWAWERRYPQTFSFSAHGGFSFILYTPWTTTDDLRENIHALRTLRPLGHDPRFALRTRAQLIRGRAITALAERDDLTAEAMEDHAFDSGCITDHDQQEIPWRFAAPAVALLYRLSRRLAGDPEVPADDAQLAALSRWQRDLPAHCQDVLDLLQLAADHLDAHPEVTTVEALLDGLGEAIARAPGAAAPLWVDLGEKGIQLCVQGACDLGCLFCNLSKDPPAVDEQEHLEQLSAAIEGLGARGVRRASWGIHHREPTAFEHLPRLLSQAREQGITDNLVITNAMRTADGDYVRRLQEAGATGLVVTLVEYDDVSADQLCQGSGVVPARRQTFEHCRDLGLSVRPVLLLMRANYQRVGQMLDLYGDLLEAPTLQLVQPSMKERTPWFLPPVSGVVQAVAQAARARPSVSMTLVDIPRCVRPDDNPPNLAYRDEGCGVFPGPCAGCDERADCCGFGAEYLELYGPGEARGGEVQQDPMALDELVQLCEPFTHRPESDDSQGEPVGQRLLARVRKSLLGEALPAGLTISAVELAHNHRVSVNLTYRGQRARIFVAWRNRAPASMMAAGPLALMHPRDEPLDTAAKVKAARYVLRRLAREVAR